MPFILMFVEQIVLPLKLTYTQLLLLLCPIRHRTQVFQSGFHNKLLLLWLGDIILLQNLRKPCKAPTKESIQ